MISLLYQRYRPYVWLGLAVLLLTGAVSKAVRGRIPEAVLNGGTAVVFLVVGVRDLQRTRKT